MNEVQKLPLEKVKALLWPHAKNGTKCSVGFNYNLFPLIYIPPGSSSYLYFGSSCINIVQNRTSYNLQIFPRNGHTTDIHLLVFLHFDILVSPL